MVAVLDTWTSPRGTGAERRDVFGAGETLQFNGVFFTERDEPSRVSILFIVESLFNLVSTSGGRRDFEIVFRPQLILEAEFTVGSQAQRPYASFVIPEVNLDDLIEWRGRQETASELAEGGFDSIFRPALYSFRILVRLLDVATEQSFDLSTPWNYAIIS